MAAKRRFAVLTGAVLAPESDAIVQQIVRDAATALGSPAAAVSLVLERTVFLRDAAPVEITDSLTEDRFSRAPYECFGTRAYLGMPIAIRGVIVGSLCVF